MKEIKFEFVYMCIIYIPGAKAYSTIIIAGKFEGSYICQIRPKAFFKIDFKLLVWSSTDIRPHLLVIIHTCQYFIWACAPISVNNSIFCLYSYLQYTFNKKACAFYQRSILRPVYRVGCLPSHIYNYRVVKV